MPPPRGAVAAAQVGGQGDEQKLSFAELEKARKLRNRNEVRRAAERLLVKRSSYLRTPDDCKVIAEALKDIPVLKSLKTESLVLLARHIRFQHFEEDKVVFRTGDRADKAYIVWRGMVSVASKSYWDLLEFAEHLDHLDEERQTVWERIKGCCSKEKESDKDKKNSKSKKSKSRKSGREDIELVPTGKSSSALNLDAVKEAYISTSSDSSADRKTSSGALHSDTLKKQGSTRSKSNGRKSKNSNGKRPNSSRRRKKKKSPDDSDDDEEALKMKGGQLRGGARSELYAATTPEDDDDFDALDAPDWDEIDVSLLPQQYTVEDFLQPAHEDDEAYAARVGRHRLHAPDSNTEALGSDVEDEMNVSSGLLRGGGKEEKKGRSIDERVRKRLVLPP